MVEKMNSEIDLSHDEIKTKDATVNVNFEDGENTDYEIRQWRLYPPRVYNYLSLVRK